MLNEISPPKIQGYASAPAIIANAASALRWRDPISVSAAAEKHRYLENLGGGYVGPWRNDLAPYLVRPMDCLSSGEWRLVVVMGPGQSGKSEIPNNWLLQSLIYDPADLIWCQADKAMMRDYVVRRIDDMIALSPELRRLQRVDRSANNIFSKHFKGAWIWFIWPVSSQMRSRPAPRFVVDDFDDVPPDIDGQGDAITLLSARQTTFEGRAVGFVASSPSLGANAGIEPLVGEGTDERFWWRCAECGEYFAADFDKQLRFKGHSAGEPAAAGEGTPEEARSTAHVVCPNNGCIVEPQHKGEMLSRGLWVARGQTVTAKGKLKGALAECSIASFRIDGLIGFSSWGELAEVWRRSDLAFIARQDEGPRRAFWNTRGGKNYTSLLATAAPVAAADLEVRGETYKLGSIPHGPIVLTAAVDVQRNRFEVMVKGWAEGFESWIVDRFAILQLDDGRTKIDPAHYPEHWGVLLEKVIWRRYETAEGVAVPILNTAIDTGGIEGVSTNAARFWYTARSAGVANGCITLVKGGNNPKARILPPPTYMETDVRGRAKKRGPRLWVPNVNAIKDIINVRLHRPEPGPGFIHMPADLDEAYLHEMTAEEKEGAFWKKVGAHNETLDLEVYNIVAAMRWAGERADMGWVPESYRVPESTATKQPPTARPSRKARTVSRWMRR